MSKKPVRHPGKQIFQEWEILTLAALYIFKLAHRRAILLLSWAAFRYSNNEFYLAANFRLACGPLGNGSGI